MFETVLLSRTEWNLHATWKSYLKLWRWKKGIHSKNFDRGFQAGRECHREVCGKNMSAKSYHIRTHDLDEIPDCSEYQQFIQEWATRVPDEIECDQIENMFKLTIPEWHKDGCKRKFDEDYRVNWLTETHCQRVRMIPNQHVICMCYCRTEATRGRALPTSATSATTTATATTATTATCGGGLLLNPDKAAATDAAKPPKPRVRQLPLWMTAPAKKQKTLEL